MAKLEELVYRAATPVLAVSLPMAGIVAMSMVLQTLTNNLSLCRSSVTVMLVRLMLASQLILNRTDRAIRSAVDSPLTLHIISVLRPLEISYIMAAWVISSQPEFAANPHNVQQVARLLDNLEPWLREAAPNEPLNVFIGAENPIGKTSQASLDHQSFSLAAQ